MSARDLEHTVSLSDLRSFLQVRGWERQSTDDEWEVFTLQLPGMDDEARVALPRHPRTDTALHKRRVEKSVKGAIETVAGLSEEDPEEVAATIRGEDRDVLRIRFPVVDGTSSLSLVDATKHLKELKSLVAYATAAIEDPKPVHSGYRGRMRKMTQHFQFGHTFAGSFGLSIENPITTPPQHLRQFFDDRSPSSDVQVDPFEHRVMERIAQGLVQISQASDEGGVDRLVEGYREGVNANMCESLANSLERVSGGITYEFHWSPRVDVPSELEETGSVRLSSQTVPMLKRANKKLREREPEEVEVVGRVVQLSSREPTRLGSEKSVRIEVTEGGGPDEPETVITDLGTEAYHTAIRAHEEETFVRVKGRLTRSGNFWHLADAHDFEKWRPKSRR
jgi:hypothetical protein